MATIAESPWGRLQEKIQNGCDNLRIRPYCTKTIQSSEDGPMQQETIENTLSGENPEIWIDSVTPFGFVWANRWPTRATTVSAVISKINEQPMRLQLQLEDSTHGQAHFYL
ncbi:MAG: hypothetical protein GY878_05255 [Fuerstiella sp.]|nr:hypothetical protein [Fuerstiella sp.]